MTTTSKALIEVFGSCILTRGDKPRCIGQVMAFMACSTCLSIRIYPYMGFMTGQQYQCQDCETISPIVIEFDTEEDFNAFLEARLGDQEE